MNSRPVRAGMRRRSLLPPADSSPGAESASTKNEKKFKVARRLQRVPRPRYSDHYGQLGPPRHNHSSDGAQVSVHRLRIWAGAEIEPDRGVALGRTVLRGIQDNARPKGRN